MVALYGMTWLIFSLWLFDDENDDFAVLMFAVSLMVLVVAYFAKNTNARAGAIIGIIGSMVFALSKYIKRAKCAARRAGAEPK